MTRRSMNLMQFWFVLANFSIPMLSFALAGYLRFFSGFFTDPNTDLYSYTAWIVITTIVWAVFVEHHKLSNLETLSTFRTGIKATSKATLSTATCVLALLFFYREISLSRIFMGAGILLLFLFELVLLHAFRFLFLSRQSPLTRRIRLAIVGADDYALRIHRQLNENHFVHCEVACFVTLPEQTPTVRDFPALQWDQVEEVVEVYQCQEIIVALPPDRFGQFHQIVEPLQHLCVPVRVVMDFGHGAVVPDRVFSFYGVPLLDVQRYPVDTISYLVVKQVFDFVFASMALIVLSPLMALIALAIKLTSPGPVFFAQERVSLNGKRFKMLKFRTMLLQDSAASNQQHTQRRDPRITAVGKFLRRTSLDELPQFLNVVRGDMSVVGPRPELTYFVEKFRTEIPAYMGRHNVKCGITGWAQINGFRGSDTSIAERIRFDQYYMQNWSLAFDLEIICRTLVNGMLSKAAF